MIVKPSPSDHRTFLAAVNELLARLVSEYQPEKLFAIRLSKWFDHKWLRYSGKGRVHFPSGYPFIDTALDKHSQSKLTLPPFNPKQVTTEQHWQRRDDKGYARCSPRGNWVHRRVLEHSSSNLHRRVRERWSSAVLFWFSSNTVQNQHGSVMVYVVLPELESTWYASFRQATSWHVERVKGIDKEEVQRWFPLG